MLVTVSFEEDRAWMVFEGSLQKINPISDSGTKGYANCFIFCGSSSGQFSEGNYKSSIDM